MKIQAPRGTYDILPEESWKWQYVEQVIKETAELFGYKEVRTPIFEHTELFERGVGESTDIVAKEMYTFTDKAERSITLRPEGTASCVRSFVENRLFGGVLPIKWYYFGPMFRYDRPQTGRYRQFYQFGVEAFGSDSPLLDVEIILLLVEILTKLELTDYELHINSVGCLECRTVYRQKLIDYITPISKKLCKDCNSRYDNNPLRVLDCKNDTCKQAIEGFPILYNSLCNNCTNHYQSVLSVLKDNEISFVHDDNLVRGLDYYTNTAFEVHLKSIGAQSAIGGGGRYDNLVAQCGGPDTPGIGFAIGMERLLLALDDKVNLNKDSLDTFVVVMDKSFELYATNLLNKLRRENIKADIDYNNRSAKAQMKYAHKLGAKTTIFIGEEEIKTEKFTIRNMKTKDQVQANISELISTVKNIIS
ncbi:Histidyl-tRNA synthetase [Candidatus Syntrophocurvum alkaliphilum]|uniref:Histidine--tRNA ligase n=1 Tax=Candidatus Syntrophocurvum alkaliphilum TaxID=2293317 RepID=A0A6I6DHP7_9FIRM|nr:histidine--tRNA ligase [Candidatus Syntrophocurvum alkaliphilum]QGT99119.1 Histidyl-tRNA synthetase [Candidatus Syntrophocurvum alkaliphilum]